MTGYGETHSDREIRDGLIHRLEEDEYVDGNDLEITVQDGVVTLAGNVASLDQGHRAEALAAAYPGVRQVINHLGMRRSDPTAMAPGEIGSSPEDGDTHTTGVIGDMNEPATLKATHTNSLTRR